MKYEVIRPLSSAPAPTPNQSTNPSPFSEIVLRSYKKGACVLSALSVLGGSEAIAAEQTNATTGPSLFTKVIENEQVFTWSDYRYKVQFAPDLGGARWRDISSNVEFKDGVFEARLSLESTNHQQFFRLASSVDEVYQRTHINWLTNQYRPVLLQIENDIKTLTPLLEKERRGESVPWKTLLNVQNSPEAIAIGRVVQAQQAYDGTAALLSFHKLTGNDRFLNAAKGLAEAYARGYAIPYGGVVPAYCNYGNG